MAIEAIERDSGEAKAERVLKTIDRESEVAWRQLKGPQKQLKKPQKQLRGPHRQLGGP